MSHRYLYFMLSAGMALVMFTGCKKDKENSAVVEEVPAAAPPAETDTSATLAEEPNLKQVGKDKPGSVKGTFHPSGKGKEMAGAAASEAGFSDAGRFVVQVAIFKSKRQAASLVEKLSGQGYPAYVAEVENPVPELAGTYHRVRIGKFQRIADARAFGENTLKPLGYDFWVDNKKNDGMGGTGGDYSAPAAEPAATEGAATTGEMPAAEAPAPRKAKKAKTSATQPSEPSAPPSGTWGNEPSAPKSGEPAAPSGDSWGNPAGNEATASKPAASSDLPGTNPASAAPAAPSAPASSPAPKDSGKVNLDEW